MLTDAEKEQKNTPSSQPGASAEPILPRRDLRSILLMVFVVIATLIGATCAIISLIFDPSARAFHFGVARRWARVLLKASGIRVEVEGLENFDPNRPYVFMSNHQCNFDIVAILAGLPAHFRVIAKSEVMKVPGFGWTVRRGGHIIVDRTDRAQAFASYNDAARKIQAGTSILVFAEGTRSADGTVGPFKKGGFVLAIQAGVPIVPITISGGRKILPRQKIVFRKGVMKIVVDKPIETRSYRYEDRDDLIKRVREVIISNLREDEVDTLNKALGLQ